ncbi:MAG: dnaK [Segetibacter sp.]|nr:dnaK [Segetibacter sp.]
MGKIIGIDLGTTNSCVAVIENGVPVIIETGLGSRILKSAVRILENGEIVVGENAYRARILDPENTITGIKRFMGRRYNEVFDISQTVPYKIVIGDNNLAMINAHENFYTPQYISASILRALKVSAETHLEEEISEVVITVPAYFNEIQRQATIEAGEIAGFNVRRIINEPTSAALAYGLNKTKLDAKIAIFDLGGGTFDISILELGEGVFEVKSISGDGFLGGDDFDTMIVKWILHELEIRYSIDLSQDPVALELIREAATKAKCELSFVEEAPIELPVIDNKNFILNITRLKFEEICEELFERLINPCEVALKEAEYSSNQIEQVILIGGATRMPKITEIVMRVFGALPLKGINPDEAVALGAAVQAGVLSGSVKDVLLLDVTAIALGVETVGGVTTKMINANTTIPTRKTQIFTTSLNNQTSIELNILEGEDKLAINNKSIGRIILEGIEASIAGEPQIEVTFDIDANGKLNVSAKDKLVGNTKTIRIEGLTGLSKDEQSKKILSVKHV